MNTLVSRSEFSWLTVVTQSTQWNGEGRRPSRQIQSRALPETGPGWGILLTCYEPVPRTDARP
jgi:hypothetical protein